MEELEFDDYVAQPKKELRIVFENLWNAIYTFVEKYKAQTLLLDSLKTENEQLNKEIDTLKSQISLVEQKLSQVPTQQYSYGDSTDSILFDTQNVERQNDISKEIEFLKKENEDLRLKLKELNKENPESLVDFVNFQTLSEQNLQLINQNQELRLENEKLIHLVEELRRELISLRQRNIELEKMANFSQAISDEISQLESRLEKVVIEKNDKEREIENLREKLRIIDTNPKLPQIFPESNFEFFLDKLQTNELIAKFFGMSDLSDIDSFIQKLSEFLMDKEELRKKLLELESKNLELYNLIQNQKQAKNDEFVELKEEIEVHKNRIAGLENELVERNKKIFEIGNNYQILLEEKHNLELSISELLAKIDVLEKFQNDVQEEIKENQVLKGQLLQKNQEIKSLADEISHYRASIDELSYQIESLNFEINELKREKITFEETVAELQKNNKSLVEKLTESSQYKHEFYRLQNEMNSLKQMNIELNEINKQRTTEKLELESKIFRLSKEKNELLDKIEGLTHEKDRLGIILDERDKKLAVNLAEIVQMKNKLEETDKSKQILVDRVERLIAQIDSYIAEFE